MMNIEQAILLYSQSKNADHEKVVAALNSVEKDLGDDFVYFVNACGCKSQFTSFVESMDYVTTEWIAKNHSMMVVRYNTEWIAADPERSANYVYAYAFGNGNQCSGDGWKYRRRGALLSLVGRRNYDICSNQLYGDNRLIEQPWLVEEAQTAVDVAVWFWKYYNCGTYKNNTEKLFKRLNSSNNIDVDVISAESKLHKLQRLIVV